MLRRVFGPCSPCFSAQACGTSDQQTRISAPRDDSFVRTWLSIAEDSVQGILGRVCRRHQLCAWKIARKKSAIPLRDELNYRLGLSVVFPGKKVVTPSFDEFLFLLDQ